MRLQIVRPLPDRFEDYDLRHLRFGATHELSPPLSDLLIVLGYAILVDEPFAGVNNGANGKPPVGRTKRRKRR